jgi:hypothetical protein
MNDMDNELIVLGPQLVKGKAVRLAKARQASLAARSAKLILMLQQVYPRDSRFVIPETDYTRFYADRQPSHLMRLWAGYMEPPGQHGGAIRAFAGHRHDEMHYDAGLLTALSLPASPGGQASIHRVNSDVALLCLPRLVMIRTVFQRAAFPPLTCSAACPVLRLGTGTGGGRGGRGVR